MILALTKVVRIRTDCVTPGSMYSMYSLPKSYKSMPEWSFFWIKLFKNRLFSSKTILRQRSRLIFSTGAGA
jgi:hypothetical protein